MRYEPKLVDKVCYLYTHGIQSIESISLELDMTSFEVSVCLAMRDVVIRKPHSHLYAQNKQEFARMVHEGRTNAYIRSRLNICGHTVTKWRKKLKSEEMAETAQESLTTTKNTLTDE